jgi:hypothetical protein
MGASGPWAGEVSTSSPGQWAGEFLLAGFSGRSLVDLPLMFAKVLASCSRAICDSFLCVCVCVCLSLSLLFVSHYNFSVLLYKRVLAQYLCTLIALLCVVVAL